MARGSLDQIIRRLNNMSKRGRAKMKKSPFLALSELPVAAQVRELKKAAKEMENIYKVVIRLAVARESADASHTEKFLQAVNNLERQQRRAMSRHKPVLFRE